MFTQLTKYLLQYRQMSIPAIGTFKLIPTRAVHNIADKTIEPPGYTIEFSEKTADLKHQLSYLAACLHCDEMTVKDKLEQFSSVLRTHLQQGAFLWKGLGTLKLDDETIDFYPSKPNFNLFTPEPADKVMHEDTRHTILVGDEEVVSVINKNTKVRKRGKSVIVIIAVILILISLALIGLHFYKNGLNPSSTGNQMKIEVAK